MGLPEKVEVQVVGSTLKYWNSLGYLCKVGDIVSVSVEELQPNSQVKVTFTCVNCGESYLMPYSSYIRKADKGHCKYCTSSTKLHYEHVKEVFESKGYKIIEANYTNARIAVGYTCFKHPEVTQYISINSLKNGSGCKYCALESKASKRRLSLDKVKETFDAAGYTLISTEYKGNRYHLEYICPKHPDKVQRMKYNNFQQGNRCPLCYEESKKYRPSINGNTPIGTLLRCYINEWKLKSLSRWNWCCAVTGERSSIIHHPISFTFLMFQAFATTGVTYKERLRDYEEWELKALEAEIVRLHSLVGLGICVSPHIHRDFHSQHPREFTEEQFWKFAEEYKETNGQS